MTFGFVKISEAQSEIIKQIQQLFTDYKARKNDPVYFKDIDCENGILTSVQADIMDSLAYPPADRPSIMELVIEFEKKSPSAIQKPRDSARKKIIEAIITLSMVLDDEDFLKYFIGAVL